MKTYIENISVDIQPYVRSAADIVEDHVDQQNREVHWQKDCVNTFIAL